MMAVAARETTRARLIPMATNPVTRHPAIAAAAIATVDALSGGRASFGYGRGNSAVRNLGEKPANTELLRDHLRTVRELLNGRSTTWRGKPVRADWITSPVPVILSAYGPKTKALAGQIADGVILCDGADPAIVRSGIELVRRSAEDAGRNPAGIEIWVMTRASVRDTREEARADVEGNVASGALLIPLDEHVPDEIRPRLVAARQRYDFGRHVLTHGRNIELMRELGLADYLADRLSIAGTADEARAKAAAIADLGVDVLYFAGSVRDPANAIRRLGTELASG
jgi:5,10-methylenetetrahydromethanopterin reductase